MTQHAASEEAKEKTAALLAGLWKRNQPLIQSRFAVLVRAREQALVGSLTEEMRADAAGVAHKFAGSLGMFGLTLGTEISRELEVALEPVGESVALDLARIASLVEQLRLVLFPES
jgi:HPt (histidine-containing phosphotransfer) domain-containing protein